MNTQTLTIQEFQQMMQSSDKKLPEFLSKITKVAKPEDVRNIAKIAGDGTFGWGWPRG